MRRPSYPPYTLPHPPPYEPSLEETPFREPYASAGDAAIFDIGISGQNYVVGLALTAVYDYDSRPAINRFIVVIFYILFFFFTVTAIFICVAMTEDPINYILKENTWLLCIGLLVYLLPGWLVHITKDRFRSVAFNCLLLFTATSGLSIFVGGIAAQVETIIAPAAFFIVCILCLFLAYLAGSEAPAFSGFDFSGRKVFAIVFSVIVIQVVLGLMLIPIVFINFIPWHFIMAGLLALYISFLIVVQLQVILDGRSILLEPEDFGCGALLLYTSVWQVCFGNRYRIPGSPWVEYEPRENLDGLS